mmetsp:Transcript_20682/g.48645  ORF Transcript_20682/g.48645 Transcript_20682/m.48645 type:complete len:205 (-) Transcript_20682:386-1000(-)
MVPPYTMIPGRLRRPMAMMHPGMFLSHPGNAMSPSYHWADMVVSMESAIRSRDCSEKRIPEVPMEIPSDTPTVLKRMPTQSAPTTPSLTYSESSRRCMLQGFPSYQTEQIPTCGLSMSSSVMPVAYSMAWELPWTAGWVRTRLHRFRMGPSSSSASSAMKSDEEETLVAVLAEGMVNDHAFEAKRAQAAASVEAVTFISWCDVM